MQQSQDLINVTRLQSKDYLEKFFISTQMTVLIASWPESTLQISWCHHDGTYERRSENSSILVKVALTQFPLSHSHNQNAWRPTKLVSATFFYWSAGSVRPTWPGAERGPPTRTCLLEWRPGTACSTFCLCRWNTTDPTPVREGKEILTCSWQIYFYIY